MRRVYHHVTDPAAFTADLFEAVRPGGRVAAIDFSPRGWMFWLRRPPGVAENRGGHGAPAELVIEELTKAGFVLEQQIDDWPGRDYCCRRSQVAIMGRGQTCRRPTSSASP